MDNKEIKNEDILNYDLSKEEKDTITIDSTRIISRSNNKAKFWFR